MTNFYMIAIGVAIGLCIWFVCNLHNAHRLRRDLEASAAEYDLHRHPGESTASLAARLREHEILCEADALVDMVLDSAPPVDHRVPEPMPPESVLLEIAYRIGNVGEA